MWKSCLTILCFLISVTLLDTFAISSDLDEQPIKYNHKIHLEEADLTCLDCHQNATSQARASIPNISFCGDCHDDVGSENPEERKLAEYVSNGIDIPWVQVHVVPDHAYFSHRRHVTLGQLDCSECHGNVAQMEIPFEAPSNSINMDW